MGKQNHQPAGGINPTHFLTGECKRLERIIEKQRGLIVYQQSEAQVQAQVLATLVDQLHDGEVLMSETMRAAAGDSCLWRTKLVPQPSAVDGQPGDVLVTVVKVTEEEALKIEELKKQPSIPGLEL